MLGELQVFLESCIPRRESYDGKKYSSTSLQDIKDTMETSYACIFPETFKFINIILALPIGIASVERSFSHSRLSDRSVAQLLRISIEGPEIDAVEFEEILEIFKEYNHRILL